MGFPNQSLEYDLYVHPLRCYEFMIVMAME